MEIKPIAKIKNDFNNKFAIPRQSGLTEITSQIIFSREYSDSVCIKGLEGFSHIWLIWGFSENIKENHSLTVRPPRLGGNKRVGVFATRSPFRPNNLGLSSVKIEKIEYDKHNTATITVSGADLMNGTPIYDIKPYIKFTDCHENAICGFVDENEFNQLKIVFPNELKNKISPDRISVLENALKQDPRPAYQKDSHRIYGFEFGEQEIKFKVEGNILTILSIDDNE